VKPYSQLASSNTCRYTCARSASIEATNLRVCYTQCTQWMNSLVPSCMSQYIFTRPFLACGEGCGLKTTSALAVFHQSCSVMCKLFDTIVLMYGERSNLSWGNWENPVPVLQIYMTSAHKSTHNCSNGRTGMIPCTTTHPAKSNHILCPLYEFMYIRTKKYYVLLRTDYIHCIAILNQHLT